jgi:hypothetical protein
MAKTMTMTSTLLGTDPRTADWEYGFGVSHFAVLGGSRPGSGAGGIGGNDEELFVMLAQPNLGVQRHAQLFVTKWDPATNALSPVGTSAVQPALDGGNLAWAMF